MIPSYVHQLLAQARTQDRRSAMATPAAPRRRRDGAPDPSPQLPDPVTLRFSFPDDRAALARLAALDSACPPPEPVLLAEVDGELLAALSLHDGAVVADPFRHTVALVDLLRARALQLQEPLGRRRLVRPWLPIRLGIARR